jgi:DNA-binding NtrC family response regulator
MKADDCAADIVGMQTLAALNGTLATASDAPDSSVHQTARLLFAVDDERAIAALRAALDGRAAEIVAEPLPERALSRLRSERFDIVIGDLRRDRIAGLELLTTARRERPAAVRMVVAELGKAGELLEAIAAAGVYRLLHPSVPIAELRAMIVEALEQRAALARAAAVTGSPVAAVDRLTVNP